MINTEKKFLFIRIPKTASSTLRAALTDQNFSLLDRDKINITFSVAGKKKERRGPGPERTRVNAKYIDFLNFTGEKSSFIHASYREWKEGKEDVGDYFTFSFVRNPWDWMVSQYVFLKKIYLRRLRRERQGKPAVKAFFIERRGGFIKKLNQFGLDFLDFRLDSESLTFEKYVEAYFANDPFDKTQSSFLKDESGEIAVDFIGKFETLQDDWSEVANKIGLNPVNLEQTNASRGRGRYQDYYKSEEIKKIVSDGLAEDIGQFGYEFGK
jgi:hypothetical protein